MIDEPRCVYCGKNTEESEQKSLGLTAAGWICDGSCRSRYESNTAFLGIGMDEDY